MERKELWTFLPVCHIAGGPSHRECECHVQEWRARDHLRRAAAKPTTRAAYRGQVTCAGASPPARHPEPRRRRRISIRLSGDPSLRVTMTRASARTSAQVLVDQRGHLEHRDL